MFCPIRVIRSIRIIRDPSFSLKTASASATISDNKKCHPVFPKKGERRKEQDERENLKGRESSLVPKLYLSFLIHHAVAWSGAVHCRSK
jgi:hypothetical protein